MNEKVLSILFFILTLMASFNSHSQTITMVVGAGSFIIAGEGEGEGEGEVGSEDKEGTEQKIINVHYTCPLTLRLIRLFYSFCMGIIVKARN